MDNYFPLSNQIAAINELIRGQEFVAQLGLLLRDVEPQGSDSASKLIEQVTSSLSRALSVLGSNQGGSVCSDDTKTETCNSNKRKSPAVVGAREAYRKRREASQLRTVIVSKTTLDNYSWRKYGQKNIYSSIFPRSYYRCTHKYDQQCPAIKHVQKSEDDPSLFEITYLGNHTCRTSTGDPNLIMHSSPSEPSIISFGSNISNITKESPRPSSSFFRQRQQDCDGEVLSKLNPAGGSSMGPQLDSAANQGDEKPGLHCPANSFVAHQGDDETSGLHFAGDNLDVNYMIDLLQFADDLLNPEQGVFFDRVGLT